METVKGAQQKLSLLYYDPCAKFEDPTFDDFNVIEAFTNSNHLMEWFSNFNDKEDYMAFSFASHKYHVYYNNDDGVGDLQHVTRITFSQIINKL
jgi:hypothetical protein